MTERYADFKVNCICDRDKQKQQAGWNGLKVISPEELFQMKGKVYIAICTYKFHNEIYANLVKNGFDESKIINLGAIVALLFNREYFDKSIMLPQKQEIFVDGGCYDGDTVKRFIKWCSGEYKMIYAYEPDFANYRKCIENCRAISNIELYNKGLWNTETKLPFLEKGTMGSKIGGEKESSGVISSATIDGMIDGATFIKLDVEGAELKALQGSEKVILKNRPKLAICIYHKPEDVIEIPQYILTLHNDYKLYLRHYHTWSTSTILYAI